MPSILAEPQTHPEDETRWADLLPHLVGPLLMVAGLVLVAGFAAWIIWHARRTRM